jgi:hypothetical protein
VRILCTIFGEKVPDGDGLDGGGYIPARVIDTGSSLPPSEAC